MPRCCPIRATARAAINTVLFVGLAVNVQMALALLLSGFFARRRWWIKALLIVYILPWTLPAVPAYLSFHWMLVAYPQGLLDNLISCAVRHRGAVLVQSWLARARLRYRRRYLEMDAAMDADLPRRPHGDPAGPL